MLAMLTWLPLPFHDVVRGLLRWLRLPLTVLMLQSLGLHRKLQSKSALTACLTSASDGDINTPNIQ